VPWGIERDARSGGEPRYYRERGDHRPPFGMLGDYALVVGRPVEVPLDNWPCGSPGARPMSIATIRGPSSVTLPLRRSSPVSLYSTP